MANLFLNSGNQNAIISNPMGAYGAGGVESIFIAANNTGVVVDQNVERVDLSAASSAFTFQQAGNTLKIYSNNVLTATIPIQDDDNGTQIVFTDGSVAATLSSNVLSLGGATVPATNAAGVTPTIIDNNVTSVSTGSTPLTGTAPGMYLDSGDANIIISNPMNIYGQAGTESVLIAADTTGVFVDQNVERVDFSAASSAFTFQQAGNTLKMYLNNVLTATIPIQDGDNGTQLVFTNGSVATIFSSGAISLGGTTVPVIAAAAVTPTDIDSTVTSGSTPPITGVVMDGYVAGATVFADANGDGVYNAGYEDEDGNWVNGEATGTTDAQGNFELSTFDEDGNPTQSGGSLFATGGKDISTGLAFEGTFTAPAGSTTVSPLTSLVDQVMKSGEYTPEAAKNLVSTALGLDNNIDLLNFDPNTATNASQAIPTQAAAVQVANMMNQAAAMLAGAGVGDEMTGATSATRALAELMINAALDPTTSKLDLSSTDTMQTFLTSSANKAGGAIADEVIVNVATATGNINKEMAKVATDALSAGAGINDTFTSLAHNQLAAEDIEILIGLNDSGNAADRTAGTAFTEAVAIIAANDDTPDTPDTPGGGGGGGGATAPTTLTNTAEYLTEYLESNPYAGSDINVTVTDTATIAQLTTIDAGNGAGTITYNLTNVGAGDDVTGTIKVTVADADNTDTISKLDTALDFVNTFTTGVDGTTGTGELLQFSNDDLNALLIFVKGAADAAGDDNLTTLINYVNDAGNSSAFLKALVTTGALLTFVDKIAASNTSFTFSLNNAKETTFLFNTSDNTLSFDEDGTDTVAAIPIMTLSTNTDWTSVSGDQWIVGDSNVAPVVALEAEPTFLFDTSTNTLSFDEDGTGPDLAESIVVLTGITELAGVDFTFNT